jgi:hypothetical protein
MLAINGVILIFAAVGEVAAQYRLVREVPEGAFEAEKEADTGMNLEDSTS